MGNFANNGLPADSLAEPPLKAGDLSTVIEMVYTCALDESHWQTTISTIAKLCRSQRCVLGVINFDRNPIRLIAQARFGPTPPWDQLGRFFTRLRSLPVETVATASTVGNGKSNDPCDVIGLKVLAKGQHGVVLVACRAASKGSYGTDDVCLLSRLAPHISRSLAVSDKYHLRATTFDALQTIVDALASGIYLTDRHGCLIYANLVAKRLARTGHVLRINDNHLIAADPLARAAFAEAIAKASAAKPETPVSGISIVLRRNGSKSLIATILPMNCGKDRALFSAATAAIFVRDRDIVFSTPSEAFANLYALTESELSLLLAMSPGLCIRQVAEIQGISEATAKTHLQHIFMKTGTTKQTELLHLFASYALPLLAAARAKPSSLNQDISNPSKDAA